MGRWSRAAFPWFFVVAAGCGGGGGEGEEPAAPPPESAPQPPEKAPPQDLDPLAPGPRHKLGKLHGIDVESVTTFVIQPDRPHVLRSSLAFPARTRTYLRPESDREPKRRLTYCFGGHVWVLEPQHDESVELDEPRRSSVLREIALRRAVTVWPDELTWSPPNDGLECRAELGELGSLVATLPDESGAPPTAVRSYSPDGQEHEGYVDIQWFSQDGRDWPSSFTWTVGGVPTAHEITESVLPRQRFVDAWFHPPDRRVGRAKSDRQRLRFFDLPAMTVRQRALEAGLDIATAVERADALLTEVSRELEREGLDVRPAPHIALDEAARPTALWVVLEDPPATLPEGWERWPERPAVARNLASPSAVQVVDLSDLRRAAHPERGGRILLRVLPPNRAGERPAQVVLPLDG